MLVPRDIVVLLHLAHVVDGWTMRSLGEPLGIGSGAVHRSIERLAAVGLYDRHTRGINVAVADELIRHGLRFVLDRELGAEARGVPTAWGRDPLGQLVVVDGPAPVWPSSHGQQRGPALRPIVENAESLLATAPDVALDLSLVDAIRIGAARDRALAMDLLMERLTGGVAS